MAVTHVERFDPAALSNVSVVQLEERIPPKNDAACSSHARDAASPERKLQEHICRKPKCITN